MQPPSAFFVKALANAPKMSYNLYIKAKEITMIYTLTLNPSLDYIMECEELALGETNRSKGESIRFGGKGLNVAAVLASLGVKVKAITLSGGKTGEMLEGALKEKKIDVVAVPIAAPTRINVKLLGSFVTEINAQGPYVSESEAEALLSLLDTLASGDTLVLSGSVPPSLFPHTYTKILERLSARGVRTVVDVSGAPLTAALAYAPYLIKPNRAELAQLVGKPLSSLSDIEDAARRTQALGARNVLVSLGEKGALLLDEDGKVQYKDAPKGVAKNTVGAGDSMLAGFLYAKGSGLLPLSFALAAGSATAFRGELAAREDIFALYTKM